MPHHDRHHKHHPETETPADAEAPAEPGYPEHPEEDVIRAQHKVVAASSMTTSNVLLHIGSTRIQPS